MKKLLALFLTMSVTVSLFAAFKNLQVLPRDISNDDLRSRMKSIALALGVQCDYCHVMATPDVDTPKKLVARFMFRMTGDINTKYSADFPSKKKIGCITCHNGQKVPQMI